MAGHRVRNPDARSSQAPPGRPAGCASDQKRGASRCAREATNDGTLLPYQLTWEGSANQPSERERAVAAAQHIAFGERMAVAVGWLVRMRQLQGAWQLEIGHEPAGGDRFEVEL